MCPVSVESVHEWLSVSSGTTVDGKLFQSLITLIEKAFRQIRVCTWAFNSRQGCGQIHFHLCCRMNWQKLHPGGVRCMKYQDAALWIRDDRYSFVLSHFCSCCYLKSSWLWINGSCEHSERKQSVPVFVIVACIPLKDKLLSLGQWFENNEPIVWMWLWL